MTAEAVIVETAHAEIYLVVIGVEIVTIAQFVAGLSAVKLSVAILAVLKTTAALEVVMGTLMIVVNVMAVNVNA